MPWQNYFSYMMYYKLTTIYLKLKFIDGTSFLWLMAKIIRLKSVWRQDGLKRSLRDCPSGTSFLWLMAKIIRLKRVGQVVGLPPATSTHR